MGAAMNKQIQRIHFTLVAHPGPSSFSFLKAPVYFSFYMKILAA